MNTFSSKTIESLRYYVYALVDPRDNKIFYVGKGIGNRVFAHLTCAIEGAQESDKLNIIRDIIASNNKVEHFVIRHDLDETNAPAPSSVPQDHLEE
jgi:hypothetical protein